MEFLINRLLYSLEIIDNVHDTISFEIYNFDILLERTSLAHVITSQGLETYSLEIDYVNLVISYLGLNLVLITKY